MCIKVNITTMNTLVASGYIFWPEVWIGIFKSSCSYPQGGATKIMVFFFYRTSYPLTMPWEHYVLRWWPPCLSYSRIE